MGTDLAIHEQFSEKELVKLKKNHPNAKIIAHPECPENFALC